MYPKIQVRYHVSSRSSEPLRVTFYHPDFDKADLSDIKGIVSLKFKLFNNDKELDKEHMKIRKHSLGCYVCCYSDITKRDEYNKVNVANLASLEYAKSLPNGLDKNLHCINISSMLRDPIVFLYVESRNTIDDGFIEINDKDNFEIVRVDDPDLLYVGSKIDPPKKSIWYYPAEFNFNRIELLKNRTEILKIGEYIEEIRLSYFRKRIDGMIVEHYVDIPAELWDKYKNKIPKGVKEVTKWWCSNLWSDDEDNEKMLKRLKNGEVIKVRNINKKEVEQLISWCMTGEKVTREEAIKIVRNNKYINNLPIFDTLV